MKVVLVRDVAKLGKRDGVVTVPDGYALNKLIPQGLALVANPENLKKLTATASKRAADSADEIKNISAAITYMRAQPLEIVAEANDQNHLFQALKITDIIRELLTQGHVVPPHAISITKPIKSVGVHDILMRCDGKNELVPITISRK
jgi:large subunit ribosomal protein L9